MVPGAARRAGRPAHPHHRLRGAAPGCDGGRAGRVRAGEPVLGGSGVDHLFGEPGRASRLEPPGRSLRGRPADRRLPGRARGSGGPAPGDRFALGAGDRLSPAASETLQRPVSSPAQPSRSRSIDMLGAGFVGIGSLQFGAVVLMGRYASRSHLTVPAYLMWRFGFAAFLLAGAILVLRLPFQAAPGEGLKLIGLGAFGYATEAFFFFAALNHGTAATVTLLFYTYPAMVLLLSLASGRGLPGALRASALGATMAGSALVVLSSEGIDISEAGILFAL